MPTPSSTSAPRPAIHVDGVEQPALGADVERIVVDEAVSRPARCTIRVANQPPSPSAPPFPYFGLQAVTFGRRVTVWQGRPPASLIRMFDGRVHQIGGAFPEASPPAFVIGADDGLAEFRSRARTRMFEQMSDAAMIAAIAGAHGLTVDLRLTQPQPVHAVTAQLNQSDAAFVADRLAAIGAGMWIDQGSLVVSDGGGDGAPTLTYRQDLLDFTVAADLAGQRTGVGVSGWDPRGKQVILASASDADLPAGEGGDGSGPRVLEQSLGAAVELSVDEAPATTDAARALALAHLRARASRFIAGRGVATGAVALRAGGTVTLSGLGGLFSGAYQVAAVRHEFTPDDGWRTTFEVRRPRSGPVDHADRFEETPHAVRDHRSAATGGGCTLLAPAAAPPRADSAEPHGLPVRVVAGTLVRRLRGPRHRQPGRRGPRAAARPPAVGARRRQRHQRRTATSRPGRGWPR
ncbi:MAG: contractile injection system protein, VgrG/Pvc8 family [Vicinamibacterales bacterium]